MAKAKVEAVDTDDFDTEETGPYRASKEERELGRLLKEIGMKYKDAATALVRGDDVAYTNALSLIQTYEELFAKLSKMYAENVTIEGLTDATEL